MKTVYKLDGEVVSLEHLDRIRNYMEEAAAKNYDFKFTKTKLTNVEYISDKNYYKFTLEFLS